MTQIEALYHRLTIGWQLIDQEHDPRRRWRLEDHWLALLHRYEAECDRAAAAVSQEVMAL